MFKVSFLPNFIYPSFWLKNEKNVRFRCVLDTFGAMVPFPLVLQQYNTNIKQSSSAQLCPRFEIMQIHGKMAEKIEFEGKKIKSRVAFFSILALVPLFMVPDQNGTNLK